MAKYSKEQKEAIQNRMMPPENISISLSFAEIENIIGKNFCKSAYKDASYWYPSKNRPMANVIFNAEYDANKVSIMQQTAYLEYSCFENAN